MEWMEEDGTKRKATWILRFAMDSMGKDWKSFITYFDIFAQCRGKWWKWNRWHIHTHTYLSSLRFKSATTSGRVKICNCVEITESQNRCPFSHCLSFLLPLDGDCCCCWAHPISVLHPYLFDAVSVNNLVYYFPFIRTHSFDWPREACERENQNKRNNDSEDGPWRRLTRMCLYIQNWTEAVKSGTCDLLLMRRKEQRWSARQTLAPLSSVYVWSVTTQVRWEDAVCRPICCCWVEKRNIMICFHLHIFRWEHFHRVVSFDGEMTATNRQRSQSNIIIMFSREFAHDITRLNNSQRKLSRKQFKCGVNVFVGVREGWSVSPESRAYNAHGRKKYAESTCEIMYASLAAYQIQINIISSHVNRGELNKTADKCQEMRRKNINGRSRQRHRDWARKPKIQFLSLAHSSLALRSLYG